VCTCTNGWGGSDCSQGNIYVSVILKYYSDCFCWQSAYSTKNYIGNCFVNEATDQEAIYLHKLCKIEVTLFYVSQ